MERGQCEKKSLEGVISKKIGLEGEKEFDEDMVPQEVTSLVPTSKCVVQTEARHFMKYVDNLNEWQDLLHLLGTKSKQYEILFFLI